jgi:LPS export ABC transporter protein LptC
VRPAHQRLAGAAILKGSGGVNGLTLALLAVGAAASGLLLWELREGDKPGAQLRRLGTGYYLREAELVGTGDDGQVLYRIRTSELQQNPDDGAVTLADVALNYAPRAAVPWDVTANTGSMPPDSDILQLSGNVVALTREDSGEPAAIRTDYLEIDPQSFVAYTDRPVTIELSGDRIFATGMRVYLKEDRLQLMADVTGTFTP